MLFYGFIVWTDKQKEKRHTFATQAKPNKRLNYRDVLDTLIFVLFDAYIALRAGPPMGWL